LLKRVLSLYRQEHAAECQLYSLIIGYIRDGFFYDIAYLSLFPNSGKHHGRIKETQLGQPRARSRRGWHRVRISAHVPFRLEFGHRLCFDDRVRFVDPCAGGGVCVQG